MLNSRSCMGLLLAAFCVAAVLGISSGANALMLDLTSYGADGFINNAYFLQVDPQSTGTGVISSFVRIKANGAEQGYNTDGALEFDTMAGTFTHSLLLSDVPVVNKFGVDYREFLLDINEPRGEPDYLLSLDKIEIYLGSMGDLTGYPSLGTKIFDLDAGADNWIKLDFRLDPGSGAGDMLAYIPNSLFVGPNQYVYLFSRFGDQEAVVPGTGTADGFEEWAVRVGEAPPPPIPEWSSLMLGLMGIVPVVGLKLRTRQ